MLLGRCRHQCRNRAGQPAPRRRRLLAHRPGLRRCGDFLRPARRARRHRTRAHRSARRWSRASRSSAPTYGRTSRSFAEETAAVSASPASAARASSRRWPKCISPASSPRTASIDGGMAAKSPRIQPDGRTFSYLLREGEPRITVTQNDVRAIQLAQGRALRRRASC